MENTDLYEKFKGLNQEDLNIEFIKACSDGDIDIVRYLLTSPELNDHAHIDINENIGFRLVCENGCLEVVKYLLTSPELKKHADIHSNNDIGFKRACYYGELEVLRFLIFDMNIEKNQNIVDYLNERSEEQIFNMFNIRELNEKLAEELISDKINHKKIKV